MARMWSWSERGGTTFDEWIKSSTLSRHHHYMQALSRCLEKLRRRGVGHEPTFGASDLDWLCQHKTFKTHLEQCHLLSLCRTFNVWTLNIICDHFKFMKYLAELSGEIDESEPCNNPHTFVKITFTFPSSLKIIFLIIIPSTLLYYFYSFQCRYSFTIDIYDVSCKLRNSSFSLSGETHDINDEK